MNKASGLAQVVILSLGLLPLQIGDYVARAGPNEVSQVVADAKTAIVNARYDWAIDRLEQELATKPDDPEALTFLAAARAYKERDFLKRKQYFEDAIGKGGGASFVVSHSHEISVMSVGDPSDYCRGWLHLRKGEARFVADDDAHSVVIPFSDITEFKQNRMPKLFHIRFAKDKNYNFSPRSRDERESLLIVVMYQKLSRN
jgi:hypothetical protein